MMMCPKARVAQAMRATKFTLKESENLAKQMVIHRAYKKAIKETTSLLPATTGDNCSVNAWCGDDSVPIDQDYYY